MSWEAPAKALSIALWASIRLPGGVELWALGGAMILTELRAATSLSTAGQADFWSNRVLAVARAAPSKHNDSNNLFIEDFQRTSTYLTLGGEFNAGRVNRV